MVGADGERLDLPEAVFRLLKDIVRNMQLGRAIVLIPENQQLTTQRAADLLGVSRPHLIKLLETGELPYHKVGSHRRIYLKDLLAYQRRRDAERKAVRMAEATRLYLPKWSDKIMQEVTRNLIGKFNMDLAKARRREQEIRRHFPEAWVEGFDPLIDVMTNDPKDRHVLAAAVRSHC